MLAFGPVPSRRLGRSLGINNIPPKACTYACVYCQLGRTTRMRAERRSFYSLADFLQDVHTRIDEAKAAGEQIDYLTFVPDGEPTLDANLDAEIECLRALGLKMAVISNGSLVALPQVRNTLARADWVSLKVDAVVQDVWRKVDRPHRALSLPDILDGLRAFAGTYRGELVTETMLVSGVNDSPGHLRQVADFLALLKPAIAYLAVPTRPPAESWVRPPDEEVLARSHQLLSARLDRVEYLIGYEGNRFASTGDVAEDLLSITAVHPMREDAVRQFAARAGADWALVQTLIDRGQLVETAFDGWKFYVRKLKGITEHGTPVE
jgi:wyosine [tRNA(Phe)-imidazoG37] synthetase (radical SAM superfamily)